MGFFLIIARNKKKKKGVEEVSLHFDPSEERKKKKKTSLAAKRKLDSHFRTIITWNSSFPFPPTKPIPFSMICSLFLLPLFVLFDINRSTSTTLFMNCLYHNHIAGETYQYFCQAYTISLCLLMSHSSNSSTLCRQGSVDVFFFFFTSCYFWLFDVYTGKTEGGHSWYTMSPLFNPFPLSLSWLSHSASIDTAREEWGHKLTRNAGMLHRQRISRRQSYLSVFQKKKKKR